MPSHGRGTLRMTERLAHTLGTLQLPRQSTPFIGRKKEIAAVVELLNNPACRLLTLLGPGGIGKTRLAIECGISQRNSFFDGVFFVPLTSLDSGDDIPSLLADTLSFQLNANRDAQRQIVSQLHDK